MKREQMHEFVNEGVRRYAEVTGTIETFKSGLQVWLKEILTGYGKWPDTFQPHPSGAKTGVAKRYIWAELRGTLAGRVTSMSIGAWCGHEFPTEGQTIIYAELRFDGKTEKTSFKANLGTEGVKSSPSRLYLYVEVSDDFDLGHGADLLLHELAGQLSRFASEVP